MITFFDKKGKLNICEDSLTATVFDGLKYLPSQMFWRILRHSLYHNHLPEYSLCGEMVSISFWEKWSAEGENIDNVNFVEPDIFIRFKYIDVIIEAKRYNEKQQKIHQMNKEIDVPCMITINEAAQIVKLAKYHIRQLVLQDKVKYVKAGRKYLLNLDSLINYLQNGDKKERKENNEKNIRQIRA